MPGLASVRHDAKRMDPFQETVEIAAAPARVWPILVDVERWHEWTASIRSITLRGPAPFGPGSRVRIRQPKLPPATWTVTELVPGSHFTWVSAAPLLRVTATHALVATASGTRVTLGIVHDGVLGRLLARLTNAITRRYVRLEAEGLKRRAESA